MGRPAQIIARLDAIGAALAQSGHGIALIGLGSTGLERERLDDYSDLDFFALVAPGHKAAYIDDLSWLSAVHPIAYSFRNTADGYKLLFTDAIFCEFAVFEPAELAHIPFAPGRVVWSQPGIDPLIAKPRLPAPHPDGQTPAWRLGEALTNLYIGLGRYRRGEKLSAMRFIQGYALDQTLHLAALIEVASPVSPDPFNVERRVEQRFPALAEGLGAFAQGYEHSPAAALAILSYLERHFAVEPLLAQHIRALC